MPTLFSQTTRLPGCGHTTPGFYGKSLPFPLPMTRTKTIKIRLSDEEHRCVKALAGKRGISALLRIRALGPDERQEKTDRLIVVAELARTRNTLNQIARDVERREPTAQIEIVARLVCVERELSKIKPA